MNQCQRRTGFPVSLSGHVNAFILLPDCNDVLRVIALYQSSHFPLPAYTRATLVKRHNTAVAKYRSGNHLPVHARYLPPTPSTLTQ